MGLLEDINSGKNNLVILIIGIIFIFHIYWTRQNKEHMANLDDTQKNEVKNLIYETYKIDVEAIKNLSEVANKLQAGGLIVPGSMTLKGNLLVDNTDQQNKMIVYKNGDSKPPYLFFNKQGTTGVWTGETAPWSIDETGKIMSNTLTTKGAIVSQGDISVSNKTNEGGRVRILNELKNGKADQINDWSICNLTGSYGNKLAFWRYNGDGKNIGPSLELNDDGLVKVNTSFYVKRNNYLFYPDDAKIYQNIFNALEDGSISKSGNPGGWNETMWPVSNPWNKMPQITIGHTNAYPNGCKVKVPEGKNVIWLRTPNDKWFTFQVYNNSGTDLGNFSGGYRNLNSLSPDGGTSDGYWDFHKWIPIPVPGPGEYVICSGNKKNNDGSGGWISGLAFTTNPWNLALNSAISYYWALNDGGAIGWGIDSWKNDQLGKILESKVSILNVPIVPSGKDKLFYIVEHDNDWDGLMHISIQAGNTVLERLRTTWDHPLARHHNSKSFSRFAATVIPENLTKNKNFITIKIDMSKQNQSIHFREAGTVDLY